MLSANLNCFMQFNQSTEPLFIDCVPKKDEDEKDE